jgi:hypothetical protein
LEREPLEGYLLRKVHLELRVFLGVLQEREREPGPPLVLAAVPPRVRGELVGVFLEELDRLSGLAGLDRLNI